MSLLITYQQFKDNYLVQDLRDRRGKPKHTRFIKHLFYRFAKELNDEYGFDVFTCDECNDQDHNGRPIIMELDHLNRITNDSRIENLSMKCPNCHSQTFGYKNRKVTIEEYHHQLKHAFKHHLNAL